MPRTSKKVTDDKTGANVSSEAIAKKAYELYQARGGHGGSAFDDWLEAEKQLTNGRPKAAPARPKRPRTTPRG